MSIRALSVAIGLLLLGLLGVAAFFLPVPTPRAPRDLPGDPNGPPRLLVDRHLTRSTWFRRVGAFVGFVIAIEAGVIWHGRVGIGTGDTSLFADLLAMPMLGSLVGAIASEVYNLRRRYRGTRIADLTDRRGRYRVTGETRRFRIWGAVAVVTTSIAAFGKASPLLPLAALITLTMVEVAARFVELRARPALPTDIEQADDMIRGWATMRLDRSGYGIAVLLTGWGLIGALHPLESAVLATVIAWSAWIFSFSIWRSAGRIPA